MWFFASAAEQIAKNVVAMSAAESSLLDYALHFTDRKTSSIDIRLHDTSIPRSVIPISKHDCQIYPETSDDYRIHGVKIQNQETVGNSHAPLVLLHGYMNGAAYFYRNFAGLSHHFPTVYSLDWLGWGLSSRPSQLVSTPSVQTTEDVFCESLEAWRKENKIDKMVLAGHSMGGYLSVAYAERFPQHVEKLVLLSPVGVPEQPPPGWIDRRKDQSFSTRMMFATFRYLFEHEHTPGSVLRSLSESRTRGMVENYVFNRLPAITNDEERTAVSQYLYYNAILPGSAEYCVSRILTSPFLIARNPLVNRIPNLQVPSVTFLYGTRDWMDVAGGLQSQLNAEDRTKQGLEAPNINVYHVNNAGHLLMLDNYQEFNAGVILAAGGKATTGATPTKLCPHKDMPLSGRETEFTRRVNRQFAQSRRSTEHVQTEPAV